MLHIKHNNEGQKFAHKLVQTFTSTLWPGLMSRRQNSARSQTNPKTRTCVVTGSFMTQTNEVLLSWEKLPKMAPSVA